ncbi:MAG: hypothetical protein AAF721_16215 [Myxococcota bacterium]
MSKTNRFFLFTAMALGFSACDSEIVSSFKDHESAMCACSDASCAKDEHGKFIASWDSMKSAKIDWTSDQGKKDTKGIEKAVKGYRGCLDKQVKASEATAYCQEDPAGKKDTAGCTACCVSQGRFFNSWVDPLAAGLASALGAGDVKGCTCN